LGKKVVYAESCGVGHPATEAAWAKSTSLARERHDSAVPAVFASYAKKAVREDATTKVRLELVEHEGWQLAASRLQIRQERRPVLLYRSVKQGRFRLPALVGTRPSGRLVGT
jgi:hypothetical protein